MFTESEIFEDMFIVSSISRNASFGCSETMSAMVATLGEKAETSGDEAPAVFKSRDDAGVETPNIIAINNMDILCCIPCPFAPSPNTFLLCFFLYIKKKIKKILIAFD